MPEEAPYDPYIPAGGQGGQAQGAGNARTQALQAVSQDSLRDGLVDEFEAGLRRREMPAATNDVSSDLPQQRVYPPRRPPTTNTTPFYE